MAKLLLIDTYYDRFIRSFPINPAGTYESELRAVLHQSFGTFDAYSRGLSAEGWEVRDVIANHIQLANSWAFENGARDFSKSFVAHQIEDFKPDVIFLQDLSIKLPPTNALIAAQCSCPMPSRLPKLDVVFTSFPHYVERFERMGVKAVYNPLAFDPIVLDRVGEAGDRVYDCVFVGGVGHPSHWQRGMETLEAVARAIPTFKWWGYGYETLPADSALRDKYQGQAWGLDMYRIFLQSKIVLNRHGEVAQGMTNNMRCFEATGCGAVLLTERSLNLQDFFSGTEALGYGSPDEAIAAIQSLLKNDDVRREIGRRGQERTLSDHTYAKRMKTVSDVLVGMLNPVAQ